MIHAPLADPMRGADGTLTIDCFNLSPPQSGNSWLAWCLDAHPSVSVGRPPRPGPHKTPEIFRSASDLPFVGLLSDYQQRFAHARSGDLLVDCSTYQLTDAMRGAPRILEHNPEARLVVVLRDPVARLFDHYAAARRMSDPLLVPTRFEDALEMPEFLATSRYATHLATWTERFDADRIHLLLDTDLQHEPTRTLHDLYGFLGVNRRFLPDGIHEEHAFTDPPGTPRNQRRRERGNKTPEGLRSILRARRHKEPEPVLDPTTESRLREMLAPEIDALERVLGRDLDAWRTPTVEPPGPPVRRSAGLAEA